jgi:ATP-dependent DNA ligase
LTKAAGVEILPGMPPPRWIEPQLSKLATAAPTGPQWVHEIKFDGYRMAARIDIGDVRLLTRSGLDWTAKYSATAAAFAKLKVKTAYIDGELSVSKRADLPYLPGDRGAWVKSKCLNRAEFVVVGWSDPEGSRPLIGALLLGYYEPDGRLVYAGRVGTGMPRKTLQMLHDRLRPLAIPKMPLQSGRPASSDSAVPWHCQKSIGCGPNSSPRSPI